MKHEEKCKTIRVGHDEQKELFATYSDNINR
jgi:hypothetical protein